MDELDSISVKVAATPMGTIVGEGAACADENMTAGKAIAAKKRLIRSKLKRVPLQENRWSEVLISLGISLESAPFVKSREPV